MPDWPKVGRASRRKGKRFECQVAALFRDWFEGDFQTVRNSGRTDLPGDIYRTDRQCKVIFELKHRKDVNLDSLVSQSRPCRMLIKEAELQTPACQPAVLILKDRHGLWATAIGGGAGLVTSIFLWKARLDVGGRSWWLLDGPHPDHARHLFGPIGE